MFAIFDVLAAVYVSLKFRHFDLLTALRAKCAFLNLVVLQRVVMEEVTKLAQSRSQDFSFRDRIQWSHQPCIVFFSLA